MAEEVNKGTKSALQGPWPGPEPSAKEAFVTLAVLTAPAAKVCWLCFCSSLYTRYTRK